MSSSCNHDCGSCGQSCSDRTEQNQFLVEQNAQSHIKKVIGIVSGKGGVGKSLITSLLASKMNQKGKQVAVLDADITGPSIPKAFGLTERAQGSEEGLYPVVSKHGVKVMSLNLLTDDETDPVVWRGPLLADAVKQFYGDVIWEDVDYMFVDMPPGTGDVPLTVFQSLPLAGIVIVTSPQELVSMIVAKAVKMAGMMNIPILGIVENMSYLECPDCGKKINVFGESTVEEVAKKFQIKNFARLPIDPKIAQACDAGCIEELEEDWIDPIINAIL